VQLWDIVSWEQNAEFPIETKVVSAMKFSPDGSLLVVAGADKKIRVWSLSDK